MPVLLPTYTLFNDCATGVPSVFLAGKKNGSHLRVWAMLTSMRGGSVSAMGEENWDRLLCSNQPYGISQTPLAPQTEVPEKNLTGGGMVGWTASSHLNIPTHNHLEVKLSFFLSDVIYCTFPHLQLSEGTRVTRCCFVTIWWLLMDGWMQCCAGSLTLAEGASDGGV